MRTVGSCLPGPGRAATAPPASSTRASRCARTSDAPALLTRLCRGTRPPTGRRRRARRCPPCCTRRRRPWHGDCLREPWVRSVLRPLPDKPAGVEQPVSLHLITKHRSRRLPGLRPHFHAHLVRPAVVNEGNGSAFLPFPVEPDLLDP